MSPSTKNRRNQEIKKSGKIYKNANTTARKPEKMARIFKIKSQIDKLMMVPLAILKKNKNSNKNNKKNRKKILACKHQQKKNNNSPNKI